MKQQRLPNKREVFAAPPICVTETMPTNQAAEVAEMPRALMCLDAMLERAGKALNELEARLQPVLGQRAPMGQPHDPDAQSPLAVALLQNAARAEQLAERLEELQSALRL